MAFVNLFFLTFFILTQRLSTLEIHFLEFCLVYYFFMEMFLMILMFFFNYWDKIDSVILH